MQQRCHHTSASARSLSWPPMPGPRLQRAATVWQERIQLPIRNRIFSGESWAQERRARGRLGCNADVFSVRTRHGSPRCPLLRCCALASITAASRVVSCTAARACNDPRTHQAQAHDTAQSRQHSSSRRGVLSLRQCRGRCMRASSHIHRDDQWLTRCSLRSLAAHYDHSPHVWQLHSHDDGVF